MNNNIAVLGDGSWATAIVKILTDNNLNVNWWIRLEEDLKYIKRKRKNPKYLRGVLLPLEQLNLNNSIEQTIKDCNTIIIVIPSAYIPVSLGKLPEDALENKFVISAVKGIVPELYTSPLEFVKQKFSVEDNQLGIISGPSHAEEIALEKLTYLTASANDFQKAELLAGYFAPPYVKTGISNDIFGAEYSTIMKNIMAIASGIAHGLGYGDNFQAVLVSNAIREINRFLDEVHPLARDIKRSVYLGDLLVTAYSTFSRNRTFGNMIGKGYSVTSAQMEMNMVAEGYYAVKGIHEINKKYNIDIPICKSVYNILYNNISPKYEISNLAMKLD